MKKELIKAVEENRQMNSCIIEGVVIEVAKNGKDFVVRNKNNYGTVYIYCTIPKKRLRDSLGDMLGNTIRVVGTVTGAGMIVEYAEYRPKEVEE